MKNRMLKSCCVVGLFVACPFFVSAKEIIHQSLADVCNVVSQKLAVARGGDVEALQEAQAALPAIVSTDETVIYRHLTVEESLALKLEILKTADAMLDKSFDSEKKAKAGIFGSVPWPLDKDRPEKLRGKPLWMPRQNPEDFKDANPDLYAYYKPLYDENIKNTGRHKSQGLIRSIRKDVLRDVRRTLKSEESTVAKTDRAVQCRELVDRIILDERLKKEILSEAAPDSN